MALAEAAILDDLARRLDRPFYSPAEVAALVGLSSSTILNYIHAERLAAVKLSERTYRIPRKAVLRLLGLDRPARHWSRSRRSSPSPSRSDGDRIA